MIHLCSCTGGSSSLENHNHEDDLNLCKICDGKLTVASQGAPSGNMLTMGLELPTLIDPRINWKIASKGKQRAVRRARTSFTGENRWKSPALTPKGNESATNQQLNGTGEIQVSESEELGVTLLGRRFSDAIESVPIKKRRLKLFRSPSPPSHSSHLRDFDQILESYSASNSDGLSCGKHHQEQTNISESTCPKGTDIEQFNAADFSGISILAAAACESGMVSDIGNSLCQGHSSEEEKLLAVTPSAESSSFIVIKQEQLLHAATYLCDKYDTPSTTSMPVLQTKGLDDTEWDGMNNRDSSTCCSRNVSEKTRRVENSSRDSRLHWDLNTVMDVWDTNPDDVIANTEPNATDVVSGNGDPSGKEENDGTCQDPVRYEYAKDAPYAFDDVVLAVGIPKGNGESHYYVAQGKIDEHDSSLPCGNELPQRIPQLEYASVCLNDSSTGTKLFSDQQKITCASEAESTAPGDSLCPLSQSSAMTVVMEKPKDNTCSYPPTENECSASHAVTGEDFKPNFSAQMCEIKSEMDLSISKLVSEESTNVGVAAVFNKSFADCNLNDPQVGDGSQSLSEVEKPPHICSGSSIKDHCPSISMLPDNPPDVLVDQKSCADVTTCNGSAFSVQLESLCESEKSLEVNTSLHPINGVVSHDLDELASSDIETASKHTVTAEDMKMDDSRSHSKLDAYVAHTQTDETVNIVSQPSNPSLEEAAPMIVDADSLSIHASAKSHLDDSSTIPANALLDKQAPFGYDLDSSYVGLERAVGMEKIDLEDDSQYEDGELREYALQSWEDGCEEVENEPVDYGSDCRENDAFEAAPDIPTSTYLSVDIMAQRNDGPQAGRDSDSAVLQMAQKCLSSTSKFNARSERGTAGISIEKIRRDHSRVEDACKRTEKHVRNATESSATENGFHRGSAEAKVLSSSLKTKLSGWDRLPDSIRFGHGLSIGVNSASQSASASSLDASRSHDLVRRLGSLSRRELSSQIERPKSFDGLHRDDSSYVKPSRSDGGNHLGAERRNDTLRLIARTESPHHARVSIRGDSWAKDLNRSGSSHHRSPDYYGPRSFVPPASRNAADAAVAKVESNGFVVAPDGTIIKAVGTRNGCRMQRSDGRGSPVKRDEACGMPRALESAREVSPDAHFVVGRGRSGGYGLEINRNMFHRPTPDDRIGSSLSVHQSLSRRQQSFSPHRGSLHISRSCTRSPTRSRTHSPHLWASPRGRGDARMNRISNQCGHSRSPSFKPESRMERMSSRNRCSNFDDRMVGYCSSPKNRPFSPHASRWVDERKCSSAYSRERNYKQYAGRSPPLGASSGGDRFDLVLESPGRFRHEECYRSMPSSRFPGYSVSRGNRHDGGGDDSREYCVKYEMYQSVRQFDRNDRAKQFCDDVGGDFRSGNSETRSSEIQRGYEGSYERRPRDLPSRAKEERDHYKYRRGGKRGDAYKR